MILLLGLLFVVLFGTDSHFGVMVFVYLQCLITLVLII